ncbi:MAG: hypothetical protein A3G87_07095 [Omnitrophica bacterium RIFCSPLOWO2_12_FULL_50_11]|nr:MAG: hypothetical protein A3G87_07095 [Omnitrophica bacterium RIFCSPLOWO2_12_FULL_50_11]
MYLTDQPISASDFLSRQPDESCGAVASFIGVVRSHEEECRVKGLYYDSYSSMAEKAIRSIIDEVKGRYEAHEIRVLHRVGWLEVGEVAVAITVTAPHRNEAFAAVRAVVDQIKERVPIWKKEVYADGTSEWMRCDDPAELIHEARRH